MTLKEWHADIANIREGKVGVEVPSSDPQPNYYKRNKILDKIVYLREGSRERGSIYGYNIAFNELQNYAIPLADIKKNIESHFAAADIKRKEALATRTMEDVTYYENIMKVLKLTLAMIEENIEGEEKRLYTKG